ncbi:helix-turn-helix transcriptional regulator [Klebsiella sp. 10982]|uniref:Positive transcription regulator n=1 Tax=Klebsiella quasivariicola TaxID=2026240 RepID=A0A6C2VNJ3_9ENTR|nr:MULTISPECIES: transcriptional regulator [Klebsiella]MEA1149588.1 transcriptional regulator [Klebsiella pneumoniae]QBL48651.1 transcriptional regulator [Klebsiella sp. PO552]MBF7819487.1 transcriptional regulator [Klebsiella quasivariicola]MBK2372270.1 transcriptional regulator [Klebsiella quasivariicola]MBS5207475.1 transcriptional regulator [Klebsiella sp.]
MRNINVTINTRNTFVRESLVAMVNDLTRDDMQTRFSWRNDDLSGEDIIIYEAIPGEIYLCNSLIKNRKKGSSLIILHSYEQLPEDDFMINCLKGVIFVSLKTASIPQLLAIIKSELQHCMDPLAIDAASRELSCASCPHRVLSRSQTAVVHGILEGLDMSKIAALQRVTPRTAAYHKNKIMEKYRLNNNHDFFQFMNLLRERW